MLWSCAARFLTVPSVALPGMPSQSDFTTAGQPSLAAASWSASTSRLRGVQRSRKPASTRTPALVSRVDVQASPRWFVTPVSTYASTPLAGAALSARPRPAGSAGSVTAESGAGVTTATSSEFPSPPQADRPRAIRAATSVWRRTKVGTAGRMLRRFPMTARESSGFTKPAMVGRSCDVLMTSRVRTAPVPRTSLRARPRWQFPLQAPLQQHALDAAVVGRLHIRRHPVLSQDLAGHLDHDVVGLEQAVGQVVAVA